MKEFGDFYQDYIPAEYKEVKPHLTQFLKDLNSCIEGETLEKPVLGRVLE